MCFRHFLGKCVQKLGPMWIGEKLGPPKNLVTVDMGYILGPIMEYIHNMIIIPYSISE